MISSEKNSGWLSAFGRTALICLGLTLVAACADKPDAYVERPVEDLYNDAMNHIDYDEYEDAAKLFEEVERQHPYSGWATKAQLMAAYSL